MTIARVGGRVFMVDASDRVLLIHETLEHGGTHWLTPGGGLEDGEQPREAAAREAFEETGIEVTIDADAEAVLTTRRDWSWHGVEYDQIDHFYLVRVPDGLPVQPRALTEIERETLLGSRWWTIAELTATQEILLPPDLGAVLGGLLAGGR